MGDARTDTPATTPSSPPPGSYEAVVHVHGMGDQRRYAEVSRLVDAMERWAQPGRTVTPSPGQLVELRGRFDVGRNLDVPYVGHIECKHVLLGDDGSPRPQRFRFYEAYWAPTAANEIAAKEVLGWLRGNALRPLRILRSSWRDHGRLRRSLLDPHGVLPLATRDALFDASLGFEHPNAVARYREGTFRQFLAHLRQLDLDSDVLAAAKAWRRRVRWTAVAYQAALTSALLLVALVVAGGVVGVLAILRALSRQPMLVSVLGDRIAATPANALALTGTILLGLVTGRFLQRSLGDVMYWSITRETDARAEVRAAILSHTTNTLRQVLEDPLCQRVVVVAHSLGTTIAYEALLELGRINTAENRENPFAGSIPLHKLDQFITFGSPIDKIHFFFESSTVTSATYERVREQLHGDLGAAPFSKNRSPHIHWVNLWDPADVVSGPLASPRAIVSPQIRPVEDVEVSLMRAPQPGASHTRYLEDARVVQVIFDSVFHGRYTWVDPPVMGPGHPYPDAPDYDAQLVGPRDDGAARTRQMQALVLLLPWLVTGWWAVHLVAAPGVATRVLGLAALSLGALVIGILVVGRRLRHPVEVSVPTA